MHVDIMNVGQEVRIAKDGNGRVTVEEDEMVGNAVREMVIDLGQNLTRVHLREGETDLCISLSWSCWGR